MKSDWETRRDIITCSNKVYEKGLVAASDGNISYRMNTERIVITPSGKSLADLKADDLAYIDINGTQLNFGCKPSSELPMHLEIYRQRPDVDAIIHAHPPYATAFTIAGESMSTPVLPEVIVMFGDIPTAPYATPSTSESADAIRELIKRYDVILLDHHGAVTCGKTLDEAYYKMEKLEHAAKTLIASRSLGRIIPLKSDSIQKLHMQREKNLYANFSN